MITVRQVPLDDLTARAMWDEQQAELFERYGEPDADADFAEDMPADALVASLVAEDEDGAPVGTAVLRWSPFDSGMGSAEVKRLFVRAEHRGHGHSRVLMGAIEHAARAAGAVCIVLETGVEQPEALALYERIGYDRITPYGEYRDDPRSVCFGKELPTRVLVINGTMGAGKSAVAAGAHDILSERGARNAYIDGDALCQAQPASAHDPFRQELYFENLNAIGPVYRNNGLGLIVVARVMEDPADRHRYARAFGTGGLLAEVTIARVLATEETRLQRLAVREPEGYWQDFAFARTVELSTALDGYDLDDVSVDNTGRSAKDTAAELLAQVGW